MKAIKNLFEVILLIIAFAALILCTAEAKDGSFQIIWSLSWMAVLTGSCWGLNKLGFFKTHI